MSEVGALGLDLWIFGSLDLWIFGSLDLWIFGFWIVLDFWPLSPSPHPSKSLFVFLVRQLQTARRLLRDGVDDRNHSCTDQRLGVGRQRIRVRHANERGTIIFDGGRLRDGGGDGDPPSVGAPAGVAVRATTVTGVAIIADTAAVVVDDLLQVGDRPDAIWWLWIWCSSFPCQGGGITVAGSWGCHWRVTYLWVPGWWVVPTDHAAGGESVVRITEILLLGVLIMGSCGCHEGWKAYEI